MTANTESTAPVSPLSVRILVAEDSPLNRQVALMQLERLGYDADGVENGAKALEALKQQRYDIILMDCQMPEMSGYEAAYAIRQSDQEAAEQEQSKGRIYIIAMTANTEADNRSRCEEAGMDDYINKPVELPELEAAVHRALADRATQRAIEDVLDPVVIARLRQLRMPGKTDPVTKLADLFLREAPEQLQAVEQAVEENDYTSLARVISTATSLKGSSGNIGARNLAALCDEIEQTAKNWSLEEVLPLIERARQELARVQVALEQVKQE